MKRMTSINTRHAAKMENKHGRHLRVHKVPSTLALKSTNCQSRHFVDFDTALASKLNSTFCRKFMNIGEAILRHRLLWWMLQIEEYHRNVD